MAVGAYAAYNFLVRIDGMPLVLAILLGGVCATIVGVVFGIPIDTATASHLTFMIFGSLIVFFLIVEPHGLARLWSIGKEKLRLWPFPH
jgi:branched-chain amino acid transport system permease protein